MRTQNEGETPPNYHARISVMARHNMLFIESRHNHYKKKIQQLKTSQKIILDFSDQCKIDNSLSPTSSKSLSEILKKVEKMIAFWTDLEEAYTNLVQKHELKIK